MLALELTGYSIRPMLQTYGLEREVRAIGRRSDEELRRTTNVAARQIGGTALAQAIRLSRNQSLAQGTQPVPEDIRILLEPHFPSLDFDKVRWKPSSAGFNLGSVLTRWYLTEGAVVLQDVVVFSSVRGTADIRLWAHELTHVVQYGELGVDGFARAYVLGHAEIERQAEDNALHVMERLETD